MSEIVIDPKDIDFIIERKDDKKNNTMTIGLIGGRQQTVPRDQGMRLADLMQKEQRQRRDLQEQIKRNARLQ